MAHDSGDSEQAIPPARSWRVREERLELIEAPVQVVVNDPADRRHDAKGALRGGAWSMPAIPLRLMLAAIAGTT